MAEEKEMVETEVATEVEAAPETEVTTEVTKAKKEKPVEKKSNFFVRTGNSIGKFFRDVMSEMKKVVWTPKEDVEKTWVLTVISVVILAAVIGVVDFAGAALVDWIAGLI